MPVFRLSEKLVFPPPEWADDSGLVAVGGDLSPKRLLLAYSLGIFPWYSEGDPILWWSPSPRLILELDSLHVSRRLTRTIKQKKFRLSMDEDFRRIISCCAAASLGKGRGKQGTWINAEMIEAYSALHDLGHAHSVECWQDDDLVGGLYGVALGGAFFGESMFSAVADSSKVALAFLVQHLRRLHFELLDCQVKSDHLMRLGAIEIGAKAFGERLALAVKRPMRPGKWVLEEE